MWGKTLTICKGDFDWLYISFGVVLGRVLKCIVDWYWFGLVLRNVCKREMLSKFYQNLCFCFGYRLIYNHPNEVIKIGK